jgi:hypothetical protein
MQLQLPLFVLLLSSPKGICVCRFCLFFTYLRLVITHVSEPKEQESASPIAHESSHFKIAPSKNLSSPQQHKTRVNPAQTRCALVPLIPVNLNK